MGVINPITDREVLEKMKRYLKNQSPRNYLIFRIGLNFGLSVQELLNLRIEEIVDRDVFIYRNCKIQIPESLQYEIKHYVGMTREGYLFTSARGTPISRFQLYFVLHKAAKAVGYKESIGTITLRKTFAYWTYHEKNAHLPLLSKYLNHHTMEHTLKYLGLENCEVQEESVFFVDL